jgi:dihydrodipicolinate synthase/N-acetylneuraminate lyase
VTKSDALGGVFPVLQTPFSKNGDIDEVTLRREVEWVFGCGAAGVTVAMVSEILRLEHRERRKLTDLVCEAAGPRGGAIVSVGAESTAIAVGLAEHAQSAGAAAVMATPPLAVAASERELIGYYDAIAAATDVPVIVQDASSYVGAPMPVSLLAEIQDRHGERVRFKPEAQPLGPRLSQLLEATNGAARVYDGSGGVALIDSFRRGIVGSMPAADVCWAIVRMWDALMADDYDTAYRISLPLSALLALQVSLDGYVAIEKHLLVKQQIFASAMRRGPSDFDADDGTIVHADTLFNLLKAACDLPDTAMASVDR